MRSRYSVPSLWTEAKIEELRRLVAEGLTHGEIGRRWGVTRETITGKIRRNPGLRLTPIVPKPPKKKVDFKTDNLKIKKGEKFIIKVGMHSLLFNSSYDCQWPIGDPKSPKFRFCSEPRARSKPYCEKHLRVAYLPDITMRRG